MHLHVKRINSLRAPKGALELKFKGKRTMGSQKKTVHSSYGRIRARGRNWQETNKARLCEERKGFRFSPINLHKTQTMEGGGEGARGSLETSVDTYKTA
jgi:hypothetical protein